MNIQIFENDENSNEDDETESDSNGGQIVSDKSDDTGRTDDPVRMYLKEMGNVELLSRVGEIEIAKRIESGKNKTTDAFSKVLFQWNQFSISITNTVMAINN